MRSSTYSYLSALSVCDSFVLILTMVMLIKDLDKPVRGEDRWPWDEGVYPYLFPYVHPAAFALQVGASAFCHCGAKKYMESINQKLSLVLTNWTEPSVLTKRQEQIEIFAQWKI